LVAEVESAAERELSRRIMRAGTRPEVRKAKEGTVITRQGEPGCDVMLILDGMVTVDVDGEVVAELGPGAIIGVHAALTGGTRTATVSATTDCRLAVADGADLDPDALRAVTVTQQRERSA
jgi:CRP-like cAMP-binding protein